MIAFSVFGLPTAKGRPRFTRLGHTYTPAKTAEAERDFKVQALPYAPKQPLTGPLRLVMRIYKPRPKSAPKSRLAFWTTKPDLDNLIKTVDALNGIFWVDDSQIVEIQASKSYDPKPRTEIEIHEIPIE